jgi:excisionase family DNA binding protein
MSLSEAAATLGWSRRTLVRALIRHGIPTIGTGRRARLELRDLETLKVKERSKSVGLPQEEPRAENRRRFEAMPFVSARGTLDQSSWRRVMG